MNTSADEKDIVMRKLEPAMRPDAEWLFVSNGALGGCWCRWWRLAGAEHWKGVQGDVAYECLHRALQLVLCTGRWRSLEPGIARRVRASGVQGCAT